MGKSDWKSQAIKFQTSQIRDALLQLAKTSEDLFFFWHVHTKEKTSEDPKTKASEDPKTKIKANCLATYDMKSFEFLLSMTIWYDILFAVNIVSKNLQSKDMYIDVAIYR